MKKKVLALIFALLSLLLVGTLHFDVAYGNFVPTSPDPTPPKISVISPANQTYENEVLIHLNITAVNQHQWVNHVTYILDKQEHVVYSGGIKCVNWSKVLAGLSEGPHILKVTASVKSSYFTSTSGGNPYYRTYGASSDIINFTVVYPPEISIVSLENRTFNTNGISLNFIVNEPVSKIEYCLDGKERIVIDGNLTLTGLPDGLHNVTVYATDVDGFVGVSEAAYFEIEAFPISLVLASVSVVTVIVGLGLLVYLIKRK
jgi:hypothetical protein